MSRIEQEQKIVLAMIEVYCRKKHHSKHLCSECEALAQYAHKRLTHCRYGKDKKFCSGCNTHCYAPQYREKIKEVMRFSGPWMLLYHPIMAIKHIFQH